MMSLSPPLVDIDVIRVQDLLWQAMFDLHHGRVNTYHIRFWGKQYYINVTTDSIIIYTQPQ